MATTLPGRGTGARSSTSSRGRPWSAIRPGSAAARSASSARGPASRRPAIVDGPPSTNAAAGSQRSPAATPSASPRGPLSRYEISRIGADSRGALGGPTGSARGTLAPQCSVYWPVDDGLNDTRGDGAASIHRSVDRRERPAMPYDPFTRVRIGRTDVAVTRLGFGSASIGGLFRAVDDDQAIATVTHAWDLGIRSFDVAPLYGYGAGERRLGAALRDRPRDEYVLSTKVGRLVRSADTVPPGADIDHHALDGRDDAYYEDVGDRRIVFDYSAEGVTRSLEESLARLGLDLVDLAYIHDPDDHWRAAIDGAYQALHRLREQGVVRAIGVGIKQSPMLARFAREAEMDAFLIAGRYTLLDQDALGEVLPLCVARGISVFVGGVMNSGVLA